MNKKDVMLHTGGVELTCLDECLIVDEIAFDCSTVLTALEASSLGRGKQILIINFV
jgi:hypothetical protein